MLRIITRQLILLIPALWSFLGCGPTNQQLLVDQQLLQLHKQMQDVRRNTSAVENEVETLQGQIVLLEDRIRLASKQNKSRSIARPTPPANPRHTDEGNHGLRVVELNPETPMAPEPPREVIYQKLTSSGDLVGADEAVTPAGPAPTPMKAPERPKETSRSSAEKGYDAAFAHFRNGDMAAAETAFESFVMQYPRHQLTDNSLYWWGECRYHKKDYVKALRLFQRILEEHPSGNKSPDAMVKMGLSLINLGQKTEGLQILEQVGHIYPNSASARVANGKLAAIRGKSQ